MELIAKIDPETGKFVFATSTMEDLFKEFVQFYGRTGIYFRFSLMDNDSQVSGGQERLFKKLCVMASEDTGNDYKVVYDSFLHHHSPRIETEGLFGKEYTRRKKFSEFTNKDFNNFINGCILDANETMRTKLVLYQDDKLGTILTTEKK